MGGGFTNDISKGVTHLIYRVSAESPSSGSREDEEVAGKSSGRTPCRPEGADQQPEKYPRCHGIGLYDTKRDFTIFDREREIKMNRFKQRYAALNKKMGEKYNSGGNIGCSRQISREINYLLKGTTDYEKIEKRLDDFERQLSSEADEAQIIDRQLSDGSFGVCYTEWFFKMSATQDRMIDIYFDESVPEEIKSGLLPPTFLDRINDPVRLMEYLDSILIGDIRRTGRDNYKELNRNTELLKLVLQDIPKGYWKKGVKEALVKFLKKWQNPKTGFWGPWYRDQNGEIVKTDSLSMTFHVLSYAKYSEHYDDIVGDNWSKIIQTTLAMKNCTYPNGWIEIIDGKAVKFNHHNMDVVKIFKLGWRHLKGHPEIKEQIREEIRDMLKWSLIESMGKDGLFYDPSWDAGEETWCAVSFLDRVGYFEKDKRFWINGDLPEGLPDPAIVIDKIILKLESMELDSSELRGALRKLKEIKARRGSPLKN